MQSQMLQLEQLGLKVHLVSFAFAHEHLVYFEKKKKKKKHFLSFWLLNLPAIILQHDMQQHKNNINANKFARNR